MHRQETSNSCVESAAPHGVRVLIADDNDDAALALAVLLRHEGYDVHIARDGVEAIEAAAAARPDAVLLDIGMPRMDGYEAASRLRASYGDGVWIAAVTGWGEDKDRDRTRAAGFDAHFVKPLELQTLVDLLSKVRARMAARSAGD